MLVVSALSVRFRGASSPLFSDVSFVVNHHDRVALVGANGAGKSTLLKAILGEQAIQHGSINFNPPKLSLAYLAQGLEELVNDRATISDVVVPELDALHHAECELESLAKAMAAADGARLDQLMHDYDAALMTIETLSRQVDISSIEKTLTELDLGRFDLDTPINMLSGGQKTRLGLASILVQKPDLLILDEPTNHLDITGLEWFEAWLQSFSGGVLLVSHDRTFLDRTVNRIVAIENGTARVFEGNYRQYVETLQTEHEKQWSAWRDQQVEIERMKADIRRTMDKAQKKENATTDSTQRRYAKKVAKRAKSKETRLERYLNDEDRVEKPAQSWGLKLDFADLPTTGRDVLWTENLSIGYDTPLVEDINVSLRPSERVVIQGANGQGKSTLLKTVIGELPAYSGDLRLGQRVKIGYLAQEQDILNPDFTPVETIQAVKGMNETEARSFLHYFLFAMDDAIRQVKYLSYGERARLMLARLIALGSNLLVLDEPINHLDVLSREQFEQALSSFPGSVLAVVHDRYFTERFATTVWEIENHTLKIRVLQPVLKP